jgi:ankyrin repeat protein
LLHVTAESGLLTTLQALLEAKADVTAITKNGQTPLYTAATNGEVACVVALLEAKADVNTPRNDGTTPLHAAALVGKTAVVAALLEHKANPLLKTNKTKKIALQYALLNKDNKPAADLLKPVSGKHCNTCGFSDSQVVQDGEKQLTSCGTCLAVDYCSRPCQVKDWKAGHKKQCKRLKAKRENALLHDQISADIDMD